MKQTKYIIFIVLAAFIMASCNKQIEDYQADPNNATSVPPDVILGTVLVDIAGRGTGDLGGIDSWDAVPAWNQYHCQNYNYYGDNTYSWSSGSFDPYLVMKNVIQMENEALTRGANAVNPYEAIGRFIKAYYFYNLTSLFGDVPEEEALKSADNTSPAYTSQDTVFKYVLDQLDSANADLASLISSEDNSLSASQDIYYSGSLTQWQKAVNAFRLRVLISLSSKTSDGILNVASQFATIINNPSEYPVLASQDDDLQFTYDPDGTGTYSINPFNPGAYGSIAGRYNMAYTYVNALTSISDPRVFVTCEPATALMGSDTANPAQFKYFTGASTGEDVGSMYNNAFSGKYSFINRHRYYSTYSGDPDVLVGYKEMCFNIAEAITRGWVSGDAETWYKKGITESFSFYGIDVTASSFTAYFMPADGSDPTTDPEPYTVSFDFDEYYAQSAVKLSSTAATAINQIVYQKYIAMFENSGYEAYYNWRRTGVPEFQTGTGVGNNGVIPLRWSYPTTEQTKNAANWNAALSSQGFSADDLNQTMWLLQ
ncbi:SusD/RagB family nutrient-binding outer membrane lipoprotein [Parafilimonas sp.]|uniref:SusD/RagB family nutrient-binding outer membrane lipoprotein n=1 Tax=Parafilimonas sp. TaxID=1969739 RepID=UPI0039E2AE9B